MIFITGIFPPVIFAEPNQVSLGEVKGFNKAVIDNHFSKADRETSPDRWLAEAKFGITQVICAWELIAGGLYDNPFLYEEAKAQIVKWGDEELEKRFSQWLTGRFFGKAAEETLINLSSVFTESQKTYSWHLDKDGNVIFDDKTGDPMVIRPNEEGREFSSDLALWRGDTNNIVKNSGAAFDNAMIRLYPELLAYIPAESRESMSAIINESLNVQRNVIKQEFENIAAREERIFTNRRTRDIWSLRKKSDDEAAKIFTEKLIAETDASCKKGIEELNAKIEQASAGAGDLAILGEEWLRLYKEQFERGLKAWEDAEERFFIRRIEWEQDSFKLFSEGEDIWLSAFNQFEEERQKWEANAKELFKTGENLFAKISEDFEKNIADAKKEFELNVATRAEEGTNKVKALIDIYLVCASTAVSSMDNVKFWLKQYGNSEKDMKDKDFADWVSNEIKKYSVDSLNYKALIEVQNSYNMYLSYFEKSLEAQNKIHENYTELFDTGALKNILSPDVSSDDFYLDEYQVALLRAKALVLYWERKSSIVDAVKTYAEELSSGRMTEAEGVRAWEEAKKAYNESLDAYEKELKNLNKIGEDVQKQQKKLSDLTVKLKSEEDILNNLLSQKNSLLFLTGVDLKDFYSKDFNDKYKELVIKYESLRKTGADSVYFNAINAGMLLDIAKQREAAEAINNMLKNSDNLSDEKISELNDYLNALSPDFQQEIWQSTRNSLSQLFANYNLETEQNIFPDIQLLCKAIFSLSGNFQENTTQFLSAFYKCFSTIPEWLDYEIRNWEAAFTEYITMFAVSQGLKPEKNTDELTQLHDNLYNDFLNLINDLNLNKDTDGEIVEYIDNEAIEQLKNNDVFLSISNNLTLLNYKIKITESWGKMNSFASKENEKHWRQYMTNDFIKNEGSSLSEEQDPKNNALFVSSFKEGILADALFYAVYYTNRINDSFNIYAQKNTYILPNETAEQLLNLYDQERNKVDYYFDLLYSQYNAIINSAKAYELSKLPSEQILEQISDLEKEIKTQESVVNPLKRKYFDEADNFIAIGSWYDNQYKILNIAHNNTEKNRLEYEKQDAIQRWASTSYININNIDPDNCKAKLEKARTVLTVLSDISKNENRITYNSPEYEALYTAYEQSFSNKFKVLETLQTLSAAYTQEAINNSNIYKKYQEDLFRLGTAFNYQNYTLPEEKKGWSIENAITVNDGRLAFSRNDSMILSGVSSEKAQAVIDFFNKEKHVDGEQFDISDFEKALRGLSERMSECFKNSGKFQQWSYARNYLLSSLISANGNLSFLSKNYVTREALSSNGSLANEYIKLKWYAKLTTLGSYMEDNYFDDYSESLFQKAWNELDAEEKKDLEFYVILTLTANNEYFAGFKYVYANNAYEYAKNETYSLYSEADDILDTWYRFLEWPLWKESRDVNKSTYERANSAYSGTSNSVNAWKNGLNENLNSIKNISSLYAASCQKLNDFKGEKKEGEKTTWTDLEVSLSLTKLNSDDIALIKTCWETMQKSNSGTAYKDVFEALKGLLYWADEQVKTSKNDLEKKFAGDMQNRQEKEDSFLKLVDNYINGKANINDVKAEAENTYLKNTISSKYYFDNMYATLINNLSMYINTDFNFDSLFSDKESEIISLTERTIKNKYNAELTAREAEWEMTRKDLTEKYKEWQRTTGLILENGRTDWIESAKKLQDAYKQWNVNFQSEYERVNNEWAYAYLAGLEDKEKWLEQAADAVNQASSEAFLSLVGAEGERLSRFMDTREPFGIRDAVPEAQALMSSLLQSSGITGMASAFSSLNSYTGITSPIAKRGIGGSFSWDSAHVKAAASDYAKKANEEIAKGESKKLAYSASLSAEEAKNGLINNVNTANQNFRDNMDNIFIFKGLWSKSGNNYVKDIIKGSTLFTPVITEKVTIAGYKNYIMEPINLKTDLSDDFLSGLDTITIQGLIYNIYAEIQKITNDIFGTDQKPIPFTYNREQSPGKFGTHIGHGPAEKNMETTSRGDMFYDEGAGEMGRLMSDFQYWYVIDRAGSAELTIAPWDKRMWDDGGSWFTAPSLRSAGVIAGSVLAGIASAEVGGVGAIAAGIILTSASEFICGSLDAALGYKSLDEAALSVGKTVLTNTVTNVIGGAFSGITIADNSFKGLTNIAMSKVSDPFAKVLTQTFMTGTQTFTSGVATNLINGITYDSENGFGYSGDIFSTGMKGTINSTLTSMASSFVSTGLKAINSGIDLEKIDGHNVLDQGNLQKFNGLIGSLAGQGVNYALGNDFTLNVLNLSLLTQNDKYSSGLLELHLGNNGVNMNLGTGGANVSIDNLVAAYEGTQLWNLNTKIINFGKEHNFNALTSLRLQYGYGDDRQKKQFWDILNDEVLLNTDDKDRTITETMINEDGKRVIYLAGYEDNMSRRDQYFLGAVLGYEAYRDGYAVGQTDANGERYTKESLFYNVMKASGAGLAMVDRIKKENNWFGDAFEKFAFNDFIAKDMGLVLPPNYESYYEELCSKGVMNFNITTRGNYQNDLERIPLFFSETETEINAINEQNAWTAFEKYKNIAFSYDKAASFQEYKEKYKEEFEAFKKDEDLLIKNGYKEEKFISLPGYGCVFMCTKYGLETILDEEVDAKALYEYVKNKDYFTAGNKNNLSKENMAEIMTEKSNGAFTVKCSERFYGSSPLEILNNINFTKEQYLIQLRIKDPSGQFQDNHSVMVTNIEYTKDREGNITGISKIIVANPFIIKDHIFGESSYSPTDVASWDFFKITQNKK
jgi:hypothetical protein